MIDLAQGILEEFVERSAKAPRFEGLSVHVVSGRNRDYHVEYMRRRERAKAYQRAYAQRKRAIVAVIRRSLLTIPHNDNATRDEVCLVR